MFNGIVEARSKVLQQSSHQHSKTFCFERPSCLETLSIGESIAVNGVCLTITDFDAASFWVTAVPETLSRTNLACLTVNDTVNLERALPVNGRISGHFVQGHVDAPSTILGFDSVDGVAMLLKIAIPEALSRYVVSKGYIAVDGMSVTVIDATTDWFTVTLIPHTRSVTISEYYQVGNLVNLEIDIMAKYAEKLMGASLYVR